MAEGLPKGLVISNEAASSDIRQIDHIEVEDVARLWKGISHFTTLTDYHVARLMESLSSLLYQ